jgi:hypothetical protein
MCNLRKSGLVPQLESRKSRPHSVFSFLKRRRRRRRRKMKIISFGLLAQVGPFSILGPTYRLSVFTTGYHQLPSLAFRLPISSPLASFVSLYHLLSPSACQPLLSSCNVRQSSPPASVFYFRTQASRIFHFEFRGKIYSEYNIIDLYFLGQVNLCFLV